MVSFLWDLAPDRLPQAPLDVPTDMHMLDPLREPSGFKNKQKDHMELGGKRGEGYGKNWRGESRGRFDQNTVYACMKFSSHKIKNKREESLLQFGNYMYLF